MPTPRENLNCYVFFACLDKTFFTWVGGKDLNFKVDDTQEFILPFMTTTRKYLNIFQGNKEP